MYPYFYKYNFTKKNVKNVLNEDGVFFFQIKLIAVILFDKFVFKENNILYFLYVHLCVPYIHNTYKKCYTYIFI